MKRALLRTLLLLASLAPAAAAQDPARVQNEELRREIVRMVTEDQAVRVGVGEGGKMPAEAEVRAMLGRDKANSKRMLRILKEHGFPSVRMVGKDATRSFVTMLLHSHSLELQKKALPHVERAARRGEIPMDDYAMLVDDKLGNEGKPQLYGTNFTLVNGKLALSKTQDPARLDARRRRLGLAPVAVYAKRLAEGYNTPLDESSLPSASPRK
jgi:hypothetical protein